MAMPAPQHAPPKTSWLHDPKFRGLAFQVLLCVLIAAFVAAVVHNVIVNLERAHITSGFAFWNTPAGFDISQTLIEYSIQSSTYARAFWVGLLNTLLVASLGIVFATLLGFAIGVARLSSNWLISRLARGYVETIRNIPVLLQLFFWYNAVLKALPEIRDSFVLPFGTVLNVRGLYLPRATFDHGGTAVVAALFVALVAAIALRVVTRRRQERTGATIAIGPIVLALILGLPAIVWIVARPDLTWTLPRLSRFNVDGGIEILPELAALLFGLVVYTAAFIAEVVRAGLMSVSRGQSEAAAALGLRRGQALRLVVIPQAQRVIIPPLTNQYLNLTKNSSLAVAIGYPDFVQIFTGTVLNQTGQAVEVVAITLAVYLAISLATSFAMNVYQSRVALVQR